ncbi:hypothetical protein SE17_41575, partial [Kouleothrix aurantiaca]
DRYHVKAAWVEIEGAHLQPEEQPDQRAVEMRLRGPVEGGAGDPSDALGGGDGFAIGKNAPPAAIEFIRFLTSAENQTNMTKDGLISVPVVKGSETAMTDPLLKEVQQRAGAAKYYQLYYDQYLPPAVGQAVNDSTQGLFAGTTSPEDVAKTIEDTAATELQP